MLRFDPKDRLTALIAFTRDGSESWTYGELEARVESTARGLVAAGLRPGDRVALCADNRPAWIAACLGVIRAGGVAVPLDPQLDEASLAHVLSDCTPRVVFTTTARAERLARVSRGSAPRVFLLDADVGGDDRLPSADGIDLPPVPDDSTAVIFYTSGTTGAMKGVPLTPRNLTFQIPALADSGIVRAGDRLMLPLPLHHVYPFAMGMLTPLSLGLTIVLPLSVTGPEILRAIREGKVNVIIGVPRLYEAFYAGIREGAGSRGFAASLLFGIAASAGARLRRAGLNPGRILLRPLHRRIGRSLRVMASGGAPLDPCLARRLEGLGWHIAIGYGLTETSPLLTLKPCGGGRLDSVGRPIPGVELSIDASAPGCPAAGEILARGPNVFSGYRNLPENTARAFTPDGWFRTGDLGYFDRGGFLHLAGRASTMIVTAGGENVQPDVVEAAYEECELIREAGVLERGGRLAAVIVPDLREIRRWGHRGTEGAIRDEVRWRSARLPSYQRLSDFVISPEPLERTRLGKLRRHRLAGRYDRLKRGAAAVEKAGPIPLAEMAEADVEILRDPAARAVWEWLAGRYPNRRLAPGSDLRLDLDVDSLEWLTITMEINRRTGVSLTEEAIGRIETARDLLSEVLAGTAGPERPAETMPLEEPEKVIGPARMKWLAPMGPATRAASFLLLSAIGFLMRLFFRVRAQGVENVPKEPPFLITPNHVSYLDSPAVGTALGVRRLGRVYWGGWTGVLFTNPVNRLFSRLVRIVPIDPARGAASSLAFAAAILKRGNALVLFPEGQRSLTGRLQPFRKGIGMLLDQYNVPVVPAYIHGAYEALPIRKRIPRLHRISVEFGKPLDPRELEREGKGNTPQARIVSALHDRMARVLNEGGGAARARSDN